MKSNIIFLDVSKAVPVSGKCKLLKRLTFLCGDWTKRNWGAISNTIYHKCTAVQTTPAAPHHHPHHSNFIVHFWEKLTHYKSSEFLGPSWCCCFLR